jgi:hypothetical protein
MASIVDSHFVFLLSAFNQTVSLPSFLQFTFHFMCAIRCEIIQAGMWAFFIIMPDDYSYVFLRLLVVLIDLFGKELIFDNPVNTLCKCIFT